MNVDHRLTIRPGQAHNLVITFRQVFAGTPAVPNKTWTYSSSSPTATVEAIDNAVAPATAPLDADQGLVTFNASGQKVDFSNGLVQPFDRGRPAPGYPDVRRQRVRRHDGPGVA